MIEFLQYFEKDPCPFIVLVAVITIGISIIIDSIKGNRSG